MNALISPIFRIGIVSLFLMSGFFFQTTAFAEGPPGKEIKPQESEEDDFKQTPYTRFGEFDSDEDEAEDARFFKSGRFFGLGLGVGYEGATGNRGTLYQGGFPALEAKVIYWFDFTTALVMSLGTSKHSFTGIIDGDTVATKNEVSLFKIGADIRHYLNTKDHSAPLTFSNPYLVVGAGSYKLTQSQVGGDTPFTDHSFGFNVGGGFEFIVKPKKTYFNLEAKLHSVSFSNTSTDVGLSGAKDANGKQPSLNAEGMFFTITGSILFTW